MEKIRKKTQTKWGIMWGGGGCYSIKGERAGCLSGTVVKGF